MPLTYRNLNADDDEANRRIFEHLGLTEQGAAKQGIDALASMQALARQTAQDAQAKKVQDQGLADTALRITLLGESGARDAQRFTNENDDRRARIKLAGEEWEAKQATAAQKAAQEALAARAGAAVQAGQGVDDYLAGGGRDDPALGTITGDEEVQAAFAQAQRAQQKAALDMEKERAGIDAVNARAERDRRGPVFDPAKAKREHLVDLQIQKAEEEARRGAGGKPVTGEQAQKIGEQDAALAQLGSLREDAKGQSYGISGWAQNLLPNRVKPSKRREFESKIDRVTQNLAKALEGGKLSEGDVPRYREMLANAVDSEAAFNAVLDAIDTEVRTKITAEKRALKSSGYAVPDTGIDTSVHGTEDDDGVDLFGG